MRKNLRRNHFAGFCIETAWLRPIIENTHREEVLIWDYREEDGKFATYVWLEAWDYIVVMGHWPTKRGTTVYGIITAYVTDFPRKREQLRQKYENRLA